MKLDDLPPVDYKEKVYNQVIHEAPSAEVKMPPLKFVSDDQVYNILKKDFYLKFPIGLSTLKLTDIMSSVQKIYKRLPKRYRDTSKYAFNMGTHHDRLTLFVTIRDGNLLVFF